MEVSLRKVLIRSLKLCVDLAKIQHYKVKICNCLHSIWHDFLKENHLTIYGLFPNLEMLIGVVKNEYIFTLKFINNIIKYI